MEDNKYSGSGTSVEKLVIALTLLLLIGVIAPAIIFVNREISKSDNKKEKTSISKQIKALTEKVEKLEKQVIKNKKMLEARGKK